MNVWLLLFDVILLPITLCRLILIYFFGSKYDVPNFEFVDVMFHANNPWFNQLESNLSIDTLNTDIRTSINYSSRLNNVDIPPLQNNKITDKVNDNLIDIHKSINLENNNVNEKYNAEFKKIEAELNTDLIFNE